MIFVDMDGVLCDFITAAFSAHGQRFNPKDYPRGEFACEKILGITTNEFWRRVDFGGEAFWENLEPYPWALDLVKELQQIDRVIIATSPSRSPASYSGKRRWLQKMGLCRLDAMFGAQKWLMSRPGRTLVDDGEHNTVAWEKEGGRAIVIPQPWNHAEPVDDVVKHVWKSYLESTKISHDVSTDSR